MNEQPIDINTLSNILNFVTPNTDRTEWVRNLMAIKSEFGDDAKELAQSWSATATNFKLNDFRDTWKSIKPTGGVSIGSLIHLAMQNGFKFEPMNPAQKQRLEREAQQRKIQQAKAQAMEAQRLNEQYQRVSEQAYQILEMTTPTPDNHPYLFKKGIGANGVLFGSVLNYQNALIIPLTGIDKPFIGGVQSLQFIKPDGQKRYLKGGKKAGGYYPIQWIDDAPIVICEGFATGATLAEHYTPFSSVICAFDSGNLKAIAKAFRNQHPTAQIIIAGDNDHHTERTTGTNIGQQKAIEAAKSVNGIVSIPQFAPNEAGSDWNDRYLIDIAGGAK